MASDVSTVIEGSLKHRDGKKWKPRWCIVRKLSPVADCLHLQLYREVKDRSKLGPTKSSLSLEGFLGSESAFTLDKESNTLAIICKELVVVLAFETRESLIEWQVKINTHLGEGQQFLVEIAHVPCKSRIPVGSAHLHIIDGSFCLTCGLPPRLLGNWQLGELRRYGVVSGKFCFEGGSRCGKGEGLHVLLNNHPEQISSVFDLASKGKLHANRRPYLRKETSKCGPVINNGVEHRSPKKQTNWVSTTSMCSTESSRPLLNSSDGSSTCGGSAEGLRPISFPHQLPVGFNPSTDQGLIGPATYDSDEHKENYRWPSRCSNDGKLYDLSDSAETMSIAISDTTDACNAAPEVRMLGSCTNCTLCRSRTLNRQEVNRTIGSTTSGQLIKPTFNLSTKDRDCLSVSSHGSSSSSNESNASEYSAPKNLNAESLYDRPRNILQHVHCGYSNGQKVDCPINTQTPFHLHIPISKQFSTNTLTHGTHRSNLTVTPSGIRHAGPSPVASPKWGPSSTAPMSFCTFVQPRSRSPLIMNKDLPTSPSKKHCLRPPDNGAIETPCAYCVHTDVVIDPYGNYDVPKPILCQHVQKCPSNVRSVSPLENGHKKNRISVASSDGSSDYDVPRRIKECLKSDGSLQEPFMKKPHPAKCQVSPCSVEPYQQSRSKDIVLPVCSCQRVINWAENISQTSTLHQRFENSVCNEETTRHFIEAKSVDRPPAQQCSCNCFVSKPKLKPFLPLPSSTLNSSTGFPDKSNSGSYCQYHMQHSLEANYANLEFTKPVDLYENAGAMLAPATGENHSLQSIALTSSCCHHCCQVCIQPNVINDQSSLDNGNYMEHIPVSLQQTISRTNKAQEVESSNYLMMQPCSPRKAMPLPDPIEEVTVLPLRPFMPLLLPRTSNPLSSHEDDAKVLGSNCGTIPRMFAKSCARDDALQSEQRIRSNSVVELKKRVFLRKRSSSAEGHHKTNDALVIPQTCELINDHCSNDELTVYSWPSAENISKTIDLNMSKDFQETRTLTDTICSGVSCKSGNRDSASSSDSGVSTCSPKQLVTINGSQMVLCVHQQETCMLAKTNENSACDKTCSWLQKTNVKEICASSPVQEQVMVQLCSGDSKSTTSSTMSDMSDYIETLSMSSHGSGCDTGSHDAYRISHGSATNTLRPRSCKEYQTVDRNNQPSTQTETLLDDSIDNGCVCLPLSSSSASGQYQCQDKSSLQDPIQDENFLPNT